MRERLPFFTAIVLLTILVISTWWAAHYTNSTIDLDPPRRHTHEPDSWAKDFVMLRTDEKGMVINRLDGKFMQHYPDDDSYHLEQVIVTVQQEENPITTARSDTAIMDQDGERVQLIGNATVLRQADAKGDQFSVTSDTLTLHPNQDTVQTNDPAVVVNGPNTLKGKGMYYDNTTRQLRVLNNSQATLKPSNP